MDSPEAWFHAGTPRNQGTPRFPMGLRYRLLTAGFLPGTGRTNKTAAGAQRQTVIVSVLKSLRQHLSSFTLSSVIEETRRWAESGRSCFARWAEKPWLTGHALSDDRRPSLLNRVIPVPDG
jgi:hypothetical protein